MNISLSPIPSSKAHIPFLIVLALLSVTPFTNLQETHILSEFPFKAPDTESLEKICNQGHRRRKLSEIEGAHLVLNHRPGGKVYGRGRPPPLWKIFRYLSVLRYNLVQQDG